MTISRKDFFTKACMTGACLCGFTSLATAAGTTPGATECADKEDDNALMIQDWISILLDGLDTGLKPAQVRKILKKTSEAHYNNLKMDEMLAEYIGEPDKFIAFISEKWGWKVDYNRTEQVILADECKNYCVCPVSAFKSGANQAAMCYCSEGFAERMFSKVFGKPVKAKVVSSIRRGDDRCIYRIELT